MAFSEKDDVLFENVKWQLRDSAPLRGRRAALLVAVFAGEQSKTERNVWLLEEVRLNGKKAVVVRKVLLLRALELDPVRFNCSSNRLGEV